ncbi:hypothetical protein MGG_17241 [Pyricularia oryzae 70-15]|uniref:Uncharacterized protein n=2 Tax=Pyricularia oryzae TaxID=318829 RepID=G4N9A7_PYRO7|nr:uncharacterized protein MGG_17241 [Pyricularia oryzae 70-15]EHA51148.1 hypothetical protein MGG_17241 [Pyricularia oryzae 70-15]
MENMTKIENTIPFIAPLGRELVISGAYMQALVVQQSANEFGACLVHTDVADIAQGTCPVDVDQTDLHPEYMNNGNIMSGMHPMHIAWA